MFALALTGLGAGGFHCRVDDLSVSRCGNFLLCNDDLVTDRAMFALGLAGCGAGGLDCRVDDLGVSLRGNHCLCHENLIADRAMLAFGLAGLGAGGLNCRVNDLGVSLRGNFLLCNKNLVADGAVLAFGQTSLSAGWSLCCIDYFCVAGRRDFFHTGENRITNGALRTGCMTSLGAGCGLLGNFNGSMTGSSDCFCFGFVADRAGVGHDTGILTGRRGRDLALIPTVALGGNLFLCNKNLVADGAMFALGLAGRGASSFNSIINDFGMTRSGDFLNSGDRCVANRAFDARRMTGFRAGGRLFSNINERMTGCIKHFGLGFAANSTSVSLDTGIFTGRNGRDLALIPLVSRCENDLLLLNDLAANGTLDAVRQSGFGAGSCLAGDSLLFVSRCRNNLTVADLLIAVLAVGIAGISGLGASGVFRVADLGVLV